jgi:hypothetical protein
VCIGDFNEVLSSDEHLGVSARGRHKCNNFGIAWRIVSWWTWGFLVLNIPRIIDNKGSITFVSDWIGLWLMVFLLKCLKMLKWRI